MPELTPEQRARQQIDAQLAACGWLVQDYRACDFTAGRSIALREVPLTTGPCDYLLLVDRKPLGVVEAKKQGITLSTVVVDGARAIGRVDVPNDRSVPFPERMSRDTDSSHLGFLFSCAPRNFNKHDNQCESFLENGS